MSFNDVGAQVETLRLNAYDFVFEYVLKWKKWNLLNILGHSETVPFISYANLLGHSEKTDSVP